MARVVVFKSRKDLLELRGLLFGNSDQQRLGIRKCRAYEVRGPLPPSVHATCLIVAAICDDTSSHCDLYVIRQAYAMALIRFVNVTLDSAQVGRTVVPLHTLAVEANLPNSFVELRHAATHEDLPSISVLRSMASKALQWLHSEYWSLQDTPIPDLETQNEPFLPSPEIEDNIKDAFREWRRLKRDHSVESVPPSIGERLKKYFTHHRTELFSVIFTRNIIVPAGSGPVKNREAVVGLWMPLFKYIGSQFCTELCDQVVSDLQGREWPIVGSEHRKFSMLEQWAEEFTTYMSHKGVDIASELPRPWNARVLAKYAVINSRSDLWDIANQMAAFTGIKLDIEMEEQSQGSSQGWHLMRPWVPRPLGIQ